MKIATIGAGRFANMMHYPSLADIPEADLVAICDLDSERLNETADKYKVSGRYSDYQEMIAETDPDAVYVIMPPGAMVPIALDVLATGRPVLVEKPPGMNLAESRALAEAATKAGTFGMVAFNRCYSPVTTEARRRLAQIGDVNLVVGEFHKPSHPTYQGAGSHVVADVIHIMALLHHVGGVPRSIKINNRRIGDEGAVDLVTALFDFESGVAGVLISDFASASRYERFEIHTVGGAAYILAPDTRLGAYPNAPAKAELYLEGKEIEMLDGFELAGSSEPHRGFGYFDESRHFIECVKAGKSPNTDLDFGVAVMESATQIDEG